MVQQPLSIPTTSASTTNTGPDSTSDSLPAGTTTTTTTTNRNVVTTYLQNIPSIPTTTTSTSTVNPNNNSSNNNNNLQEQADDNEEQQRLVIVRYYLDRPGYDITNSVARHWFNPPKLCTTNDIIEFLMNENITINDLLIELFIDEYGSYMNINTLNNNIMIWNFQLTTIVNPGYIIIRFTDISILSLSNQSLSTSTLNLMNNNINNNNNTNIQQHQPTTIARTTGSNSSKPTKIETTIKVEYANTIPVGLLSFSIMVGLETASLLKEFPTYNYNDPYPAQTTIVSSQSFDVTWGPYMFFVGGLLQIITAYFQVLRNNIYGTVAFFGFGSFWLANGLKLILLTFTNTNNTNTIIYTCPTTTTTSGTSNTDDFDTTTTIPEVASSLLQEPDNIGRLIVLLYILLFTLVLLKQTFTMSKLSTLLIGCLSLKILIQMFTPWMKRPFIIIQFIIGTITSIVAFYIFTIEFTNQVYHRDVFNTYKWSDEHSPEEIFGAPGKIHNTLLSKATQLRLAHSNNSPIISNDNNTGNNNNNSTPDHHHTRTTTTNTSNDNHF